MTNQPPDYRAPGEQAKPSAELVSKDVSFEVELDEEVSPTVDVAVEAPAATATNQPIIPEHLRTKAGVTSSVKRATARTAHRGAFHAVRSPKYLLLSILWGAFGLLKGISRQIRWWWLSESAPLRQHAVAKNDYEAWRRLHQEAKDAHRTRGRWLLLELLAATVGAVALVTLAPWWVWLLIGAVVLPILAHYGRPVDKPILSAAVVTHRHRTISADIVLRAYYAAGLGNPDKEEQRITFGSTMARDERDTGSQVVIDMPYGTPFSKVLEAKERIASGLDVALSQVSLTRDKTSNRRHLLWVSDLDPLSIPAGRTPLLDCKPRDIWRAIPIGLNERGLVVRLPMVFQSLLIGAQPRKGKTFFARLIALFAALDPYVRISVFDGAGKPDLRKFALVAHTYGFGLLPDRVQGDPIQNLLATLRGAKKEILERNVRLSELPTSVCPEGKLTREIARDPRYQMPVWVIVLVRPEWSTRLTTWS